MMNRTYAGFFLVFASSACGALGAGGTTATTAHSTQSVAFRGEECHGVWKRPKDAKGAELPWDSADASGNAAWAKGEAIHDGKKEEQVVEAICFDTFGHEDTFKRYLHTDDRRFDQTEAALLVDECVESGKCTSDEMMAGVVAWYAHELELTKLSAASKKLEISQEARDAFVDRSLNNVKAIDAYLATLTPAARAYAVDLPKAAHDARATYYKANADEYTTLDRILERMDRASASLLTIRSDVAVRCLDPKKCNSDPLYREVSRWLVKAYDASKMTLEAHAAELALGHGHARRGTIQAQIWAAQSAFRKLHPEVKAPIPVTEEDDTPEATDAGIEIVRGEVVAIKQEHGTSKLTFKDPTPWKRCDDTDIDNFDGPVEQTHVLYKQNCAENPAGAKIVPFIVATADVTNVKPGAIIIAAVTGPAATRHGIVGQVWVGDKLVQLGPDKFTTTSGDPLKGQP
jgi:hypothetical protein